MYGLIEVIIRGCLTGAIYTLLALPLSLLFITVGVVDMAVGCYAVAAAAIAVLIPGPVGYLAGVAFAVFASAVIGMIAIRTNRREW